VTDGTSAYATNGRVDLHIHTSGSDGRWTPSTLLPEILSRGIGLFAVANHDTTAHVAEAEKLALAAGLRFLRAVEVSARLNGTLLHILAYGVGTGASPLDEVLAHNVDTWKDYNRATIQALIDANYGFTMDEYEAFDYEPTRGGWTTLWFLIDLGLCSDIRDYFDRVVAGLPVSPAPFADAADVIAAIRSSGGVPVLAHPGGSLREASGREAALSRLVDLGLAGLECYSPYHSAEDNRRYAEWCRERGLLVTAGSDSHGGFVGRTVGLPEARLRDLKLGELAERVIGGQPTG